MSKPNHHPDEALLMEYVGGGLSESIALVVATHLALCPACRRLAEEMEMVGGALLETLEPEPVAVGALDALFARIDAPEAARPLVKRPRPASVDRRLPEPLRSYLGHGLEQVRWKPLLPGLTIADVPLADTLGQPKLLKMRGKAKVPNHTHDGLEFALVLDGGFHDDSGSFQPGDLVIGDASIRHTPVAEAEGCLCLSLTVGALKLTGAVGWLLHRLGKF